MDTRQTFDSFTEAINEHDVERISLGYSPRAVVSTPDGAFDSGHDATAYLRQFLGAFPDLHLNVWSKLTSGELVCDEWTFTGTNTGPLRLAAGDVHEATGRHVELRGCDVATVEDGQIISHRLYYDQSDLLAQLGLEAVAS
jgi:predicted ester cyclase